MEEEKKKEEVRLEEAQEKDKFIIDALNIHGSFFHKKCIEVIANTLTFNVIEKEFPVEFNGTSTKIDIVANRNANHDNTLIIECKKVDNDFKTWVFFPDITHGKGDKSVIKRGKKSPIIVDSLINVNYKDTHKEHKVGVLRYFLEPKDNEDRDIKSEVCYDAYQVKLDKNREGKINWKNIHKSAKKDGIEKACNQVLLGSRGYALQKLERVRNEKVVRYGFFIPVIATTAKIIVCDIESENISLKEGAIIDNSKTKLREEDWVVYNYKPDFMLRKENQNAFVQPKDNPSLWFDEEKINDSIDYIMSVYIVNAEALNKFLDKIQWA